MRQMKNKIVWSHSNIVNFQKNLHNRHPIAWLQGLVWFVFCEFLSARARFLSLARSKFRLWSANHRPGYLSNLPCDWLSTVWAYSEQETENWPWSFSTPVIAELYAILCYIGQCYNHTWLKFEMWKQIDCMEKHSFLNIIHDLGKKLKKKICKKYCSSWSQNDQAECMQRWLLRSRLACVIFDSDNIWLLSNDTKFLPEQFIKMKASQISTWNFNE